MSAQAPFEVTSFKAESSLVQIDRFGTVKLKLYAPKEIYGQPVYVSWEVSDNPSYAHLAWQSTRTDFDKSGVTTNSIFSVKDGKVGPYTVTATIKTTTSGSSWLTGQTKVSFTLVVNGIDINNKVGYYKGAPIEGFANCASQDTLLSVGKIDLNARYTVYFEPATHEMADGIYQIGSKFYYFINGYLQKSAKRDGNILMSISSEQICIDKYGEVKSGWQKIKGETKERYFDPQSGLLVRESFVPRGSKMVYVDYHGQCVDGIMNIGGQSYFFKNGEPQTGFVYFDANRKQVSASAAKYAMFFDPYSSPTGAARTQTFIYKGTEYWVAPARITLADGSSLSSGSIPINAFFTFNYYSDGENKYPARYFTDKSGSLIRNKLMTYDGKQYYFDENGHAITNTARVINGKMCYFGEDSSLTVIEEGIASDFHYDLDGKPQTAYYKSADSKKPSAGIYYYADAKCTKKLTNCFLYADPIGPLNDPLAYLDGNGNQVTGIRKIGSDTYYFDENGIVIFGQGVVEYKGKTYLMAKGRLGQIITGKTGWEYLPIGDSSTKEVGRWYYIKDKDGTLAVGKTVIDGKTYYFNDLHNNFNRASLCYGGMCNDYYYQTSETHTFEMGSKAYICNHAGQPISSDQAKDCYLFTGKLQHMTLDGRTFVVNKDGTAYTGFYRMDGEPCVALDGEIRQADNDALIIDKNNLYYFGADCHARTGWVKISAGTSVGDLFDYSTTVIRTDSYYYFDPKTYAATTGWKTVPVPVISSSGKVSASDKTAKLYFNETATPQFYKGALVRNTDMEIKGKTYHFAPDGTSVSEAINKSGVYESTYYSPRTHQKETSVLRKVGKKWFYFDSNGKMRDDLSVKDLDGNVVTATFNKDGSIKSFSAKNTVIIMRDCYYALGKNALPVTGVYKASAAVAAKIGGSGLYFEEDGYSPQKSVSTCSMVKSGGKYYVVKGAVIPGGNSVYVIRDYSALPVADIDSIEKYLTYSGETLSGGFRVYASKDGILKSTTADLGGFDIHTNKYGMLYEEMSSIIKIGGSWHVTYDVSGGSAGSMSIELASGSDSQSAYDSANICWNASGRITSINYSYKGNDTGTPASGYAYLPVGSGSECLICLKNGKIVTGTKRVRIDYFESVVTFDPVIGVAALQ